MHKIIHKEYETWIKNNRPEYEVIDTYIRDDIKLQHRHIKTGLTWMCSPGKFKAGISHPLISRKGRPLKITTNEYKEWIRNNRPEYEILENYINASTKILHRHIKSNIKWKISPYKFKAGHTHTSLTKCPRWTDKIYREYLINNNIPVEPIEHFVTQITPIKHKCLNTLQIFSITPQRIIQNKNYTYIQKITNTQEYKKWLSENYPTLTITEEYITSHTKINHILIDSGECWKVKPNNVIQGQHHPCTHPNSYSRKSIAWLDSLNICDMQHSINTGERYIEGVGKVDGYSKSLKTVYEFHGDFWHGNPEIFNGNDIHPIIKKTFGELYHNTIQRDKQIKQLGYNLITIWESEYNNLTS